MSNHNWQWRPATEDDIGRLARFCDHRSKFEDWWYGVLVKVDADQFDKELIWAYHCEHGGDMENEAEQFCICEVQYDANEEPL